MSRSGNPAFDAGEALAQGRFDVLRRALDRLIAPRSQMVEVISDKVIDLGIEALSDLHEDFVAGVLAGARPGAQTSDAG